ncbi:hypothetical protein [Sphingobium sp. YBL2]|uniref:hypothetical protein n=1 Tax=Sphingobium sp. (strain YBL2) TaxID=484429 RepID=UPI0005CBA73C|nr:hypothetical protein [Sphingobium sp. YBL2]AJR23378.1 hypothetical protein TZ53_06110 [Sphingobium sp. YBL2]
MPTHSRLLQGSHAWFEMVGTVVCDAFNEGGPYSAFDWTFVERYSDGAPLADGLMQGIRFDIRAGFATYRVGVWPDERGDVTIEVTVAAARALNLLHNDDPYFDSAREAALEMGALRVEGDLSPIATALAQTHDHIVDRTI